MVHDLVVFGLINDKWLFDLVGITDDLKKCDKNTENEIKNESDLDKYILETLTKQLKFWYCELVNI